jgi:hypothetical protein
MVSGRMHKTACVILAAGLLMATVGQAAESKLGPRHIDPANGFSLCPPAGVELDRGVATTRLAKWVMRDARTKAIAWQLIVRKEAGPADGISLEAFAKQVEAGLRRQPEVRVEKAAVIAVLGKPGIETALIQGARGQRWQHDLWARTSSGHLLVLSISGTLGLRGQMDELLGQVAETWKLSDPREQAEVRKANLKRGRELLAGLTQAKLAAALTSQEQWFLYRRGDKDIGFMRVKEKQARRGSTQGVEISTKAGLSLPEGQSMVIRRVMFAAADRSKEHWTETAQILRGGKVIRRMSEEGTCEGSLIVCKVTSDGRSATRKKPLEPTTAAMYLPRAFALLLGKLTDRSTPGAYGFATYTTAENEFDLRTFTVVGPTEAPPPSQSKPGIQATDQLAADAAPATLELASDGSLLRMRTDGGIVMVQSTRSAVLRRYPDAEK